ncbi:SDR family NAD(P)-dependent oxidoreductase [Nocardia pseudovaccinii]|uniref:SDR family NAD(P)-dependent oxidoreductase n=1 Tax=Nocardia pseudovaccinii TaxID=189540 RepID=UPI0007A4D0F0|nr:SDR family NAD(P)-dependent oxidoreductase [Nocardia pseudovaccinii]
MQATNSAGPRGAVLVTGASSGLGRVAAIHLAAKGFQVFAGVRSDVVGKELANESERLVPIHLDVTSESAIAAAGERIAQTCGADGLLGLVNNAGVCYSAPLECLSSEDLRYQLEVNVIGAVAVTRTFLPLLRVGTAAAGPVGRIVNVGSGVGRVASPFLGAYAASQFAKEGLSDSLRRELAAQSVSVSVIEPGAILTPIWDKVSDTAERVLEQAPPDIAALYRTRFTAFVAMNEGLAKSSRTKPEQFAKVVEHALTARNPKTRYRVGLDSLASTLAARLLPDRILDLVLAKSAGSNSAVVQTISAADTR